MIWNVLLFMTIIINTGCQNHIAYKSSVSTQKSKSKICRTKRPYVIINKHGKFHITPCKHISLSQTGIASYYSKAFHGKRTASGMPFNMNAYTAAHKTAHLPSVAKVTYNGQSRIVLINDRGPFVHGRILDCSHKLARDLGFEKQGRAFVKVQILKYETLLLKQNGGHITWDGCRAFPVKSMHTRDCIHLYPKGTI